MFIKKINNNKPEQEMHQIFNSASALWAPYNTADVIIRRAEGFSGITGFYSQSKSVALRSRIIVVFSPVAVAVSLTDSRGLWKSETSPLGEKKNT